MKPVVIIAIAVVCSVIAVLGVLSILQENTEIQFREYQQQVQVQQESIESQNKEICDKFSSNFIFTNTTYDDCIMFGFEWIMEFEREECFVDYIVPFSTNITDRCKLQLDLHYLQAIKTLKQISDEDLEMIEESITLKFNKLLELQKEYKENKEKREKAWEELLEKQEEPQYNEWGGIPISEIKTGTPLTKEEIMGEYRECLRSDKDKSECIELLEELLDKRCEWITNSSSEYDYCMSDMSVFR
jgi:hypothetical protein